MAVTITDNRTLVTEADSITGWTGVLTVFTADPDPVESTACLGMVVSQETEFSYFTMGAGVNMSGSGGLGGTLVYVWTLALGAMDTFTNGGIQILLGDGTNRVGFHVGGSDKAGFRHNDGPVAWQCFVIDTANLPTQRTVNAGSFAALNFSSITQVGVGFKTLAKAKGGVANCWVDAIRYGNGGLTITGGSAGDPGTFAQIAAADRSTGTGQAYGICRELGAGAYGLQGPLVFGNGATSTLFHDRNATVVFEDRGVGPDKYSISVTGSACVFKLGTKVGTGDTATGADGVALVVPTTQAASFLATHSAISSSLVYGSRFDGFKSGFELCSAAEGANHEFIGCIVNNSAKVRPGRVQLRDVTFSGHTGSAALLWDPNINIKNCGFSNNTSPTNNPSAVEHPLSGTFIYDGLTFSSNDFDVLNSSGGPVTINATNGSNPATTSSLSTGTVTINNTVLHRLSGLREFTEVTYVRQSDSSVLFHLENVGANGLSEYSYNYSGDTLVDIHVFHTGSVPLYIDDVTLGSTNATIPVSQRDDINYRNV